MVLGLEFVVWSLVFGTLDFGIFVSVFWVLSLEFLGLKFRDWDFKFRDLCLGFGVWTFGFRVWRFWFDI